MPFHTEESICINLLCVFVFHEMSLTALCSSGDCITQIVIRNLSPRHGYFAELTQPKHTHVFGDFAPGTATLTAALMSVRRRAFKNSVQCNNVPLKILCNSLFLGVKVQRTYFESHLHVLLPIILPDGQFTYSSEVLSIFVLMFSTRNHSKIPQMYLWYLTPMILLPCRTLVIFAIFNLQKIFTFVWSRQKVGRSSYSLCSASNL